MSEYVSLKSQELVSLLNNKEDGYEFRERRQPDWLENYTLYRDKVRYNRLTQRQSVNMPLMKQQIKTLLKDVDDMPVMVIESLDNDKQKELFLNEYWNWTVEQNRMELKDIVDKKQVFLYGRTFDQFNIEDGMVKMTNIDPQDILVSRYTDPTNLHTSRFLIHTHIYKPLSAIRENKEFDKKAIKNLEKFYQTEMGLIKVSSNSRMALEKDQKMQQMGMTDVDSPILGETMVELSYHYVYDRKEGSNEEELFLKVEADNEAILMKKPLEDVMGKTKTDFWKNHFPYNTWADDIERQDFWSDGVADMIRTPNKILNSWFSQLVENRTLRSFGMTFYDATKNPEDFVPSTFTPQPFGFYGLPGKPADIIQRVEIPDLSESLDEINFVVGMTEKASGATATQQGVQTERQVTLGEVQLALGEAKERIKGMSKFYTQAWKDRVEMFLMVIEGGADKLDPVKVYKKGRNTDDLYEKEISPEDWKSKSGYTVRIWSQEDKENSDTQDIQKLNATVSLIPGNPKLMEVYQRKLLEFSGLTPEEISDIVEYENQKRQQMMDQQLLNMQYGGQNGIVPNSATPAQAPALNPTV